MFDLDAFIADCVAARAESDAIRAVKEVLDRALARAGNVADALPATVAEFAPLYVADDLSIMKFVWGPGQAIPPHDHRMWAVNGIYGGAEENVFYRRAGGGIVEAGGRRIGPGESAMLGSDAIHAVTNPDARGCTGSIHVYGGDFLRTTRSMWDPETNVERPHDGETVRRMFEEARARAEALSDLDG